MYTLLDPFYGISSSGSEAAKWLNRALLVGELFVGYKLAQYQIQFHPVGNWVWFIGVPLFFSAIGLINGLVRKLWDIVVVIRFGTADPDEIADSIIRAENQQIEQRKNVRMIRDAVSRNSVRNNDLPVGRRPVATEPRMNLRFIDEQ